jgi:Ankyrin repeats (3 copies)
MEILNDDVLINVLEFLHKDTSSMVSVIKSLRRGAGISVLKLLEESRIGIHTDMYIDIYIHFYKEKYIPHIRNAQTKHIVLCALRRDHKKMLQLMYIRDSSGVTHQMNWACSHGGSRCINLLLDSGVDITGCFTDVLNYAAESGDVALVQRTLRNGAGWALCEGPVMRAIKMGHNGVVKLIVGELPPPPYMMREFFIASAQEGKLELVELFSERVEPEDCEKALKSLGRSNMHSGHFDVIRSLLGKGGRAVHLNDRTLSFVVNYGDQNFVKFLIDNGLDMKTQGRQMLATAAWLNRADIVMPLINAGADPNRFFRDLKSRAT